MSTTFATVLTGMPCAALAQGASGFGGNNKYSISVSSRDSIPPVVVQFSPAERGKVEMLEEDLAVMTRLLEKNLERGLGEDTVQYKGNIPLLVTSGGRSVRSMYAEGMGALFMVKLNLPLVGLPKDEARRPETASDSEWDRIRQEMSEEEASDLAGDTANSAYDEEKVESLKALILQTLKHASNIRSLRPDEFVAVSVFGNDPGGAATSSSSSSKASSPKRKAATVSATLSVPPVGVVKDGPNFPAANPAPEANLGSQVAAPVPGSPVRSRAVAAEPAATVAMRDAYAEAGKRGYGRGTVLTMRVKKSDVDVFAKGGMDFDTFKARMTLNTYFGNGYGVTSLNSWIQSGRSKSSSR
jgi:hypothetical protein